MADITVEHVRDIVEGAMGRVMTRLEGLDTSMTQQFKGTHARIGDVNARLDRVNGRLDNQGERLAAAAQQLESHETDITALKLPVLAPMAFPPRTHKRKEDGEGPDRLHARNTDKWVSRRDVQIIGATLGAIGTVIWFIVEVGPAIKALMKAWLS